MSITESLIKIRKFRYSSVWTADGKIMYRDEADIKAKVYFDWYSGKQGLCYGKAGIVFDFDGISLFLSEIFYEAFQNSKLLCPFNTFYRHTTFN